ncbi:MAG: phospholipase [Planctomycetota bacterium]
MGLILWPLTLALAQFNEPAAQVATSAPAAAATSPSGFLYRELEFNGESFAYTIYVPPEYKPDRAWPCILFLHGSGERGRDGLLQTEVGMGTAIRRHRDWFPAIVVMPQCRPDKWWTEDMADMALKCLEDTSRSYRLDADRLYLTGLSLGGYGTWLIGGRLADRFAAIVPVCGFFGRPDQPTDAEALRKLAESLKSMPIWCFHGGKDRAVNVTRSQEIVAAIRAAAGSVQYTEYPDGEHNVWDRAYGDRKLWQWLFAQKRGVASQPDRRTGD